MNKTVLGAFFFGIGMIGMLDGIVFHQILKWHSVHMHTDHFHQIMSDGYFHLLVTVIIFVAGILLWRGDAHEPSSRFWGSFLLGAGTFHLVEGIINHHLLQIHHVKPGPAQVGYDLAYDAFALLLIAAGWLLYRRKRSG
ncbi:DUF2243 domain-containing protein [Brevibacillus composti]|uniref:DUF2243 domain-containing protein n=1 Tax=Brevibacillus composti TaxID=2796470 RepID=UPI001E380DC5|nr:DUF2243 domain-containing protein [Brevibacillus composti]